MSEADLILQSSLLYYSRIGFFHHVQTIAEQGLQRFVNDAGLQFFYGFAPNEARC